ncbi:MAG: hypothetical protein AAF297_05295 [Planctomycetota bacterium]
MGIGGAGGSSADEAGAGVGSEVGSRLDAWSWEKFRESGTLTLSESSARVASQRVAPFIAAIDGPIDIDDRVREAGAAGIELKSGELWGRVAPERLDLERRTVEAQRRQLELRRLLFEALEVPRSVLEARRDLENATRTRDQIRLAAESRDDPLVREVFPDLPSTFGDETVEAAERLVEVLEENLRLALDPESSVDAIQLELAGVEVEQAELQFERLAERSELLMPFDGELVLRPELDTVGPLFVRSGDVIAGARGGEVVLNVEAGEALWLGVPSGRLEYLAEIPGGGRATASFQRRETIEVRGLPTLADRFVVADGRGAAALRRLTGATVRGRLIERLTERARLVPKLELVLASPEAFARGDWEAGVSQVWPGARVIGVGLTEVAIVPPSEPIGTDSESTEPVATEADATDATAVEGDSGDAP